jgi:hypothetical protein
MPSAHLIHSAVLALAIAVTVCATGVWSLFAVPSLVLIYVGAIYRECPYRTEIVFLSLFSAYLMLGYTGIWWWHVPNWIGPGVLFVLPLIATGTFVVAGLVSRRKASAGEPGAVRSRVSSGTLVVALLLAPFWVFAAALARLIWK